MRTYSNKRARKNRQVKPGRAAYKKEFPWCQRPGCSRRAKQLHEISRGSGIRAKAIGEPCCWLHLCVKCHEEMGDYSLWPIARQMALAELVNPHFDREQINRLRNRDPNAICQTELDEWKSTLKTED